MDGSLILGIASLGAGRLAMSRLSRTVQRKIGWRQGLSIDRSRKSERHLAPYAVDERQSRGRLVPETAEPHAHRSMPATATAFCIPPPSAG